jgi:uncharacterized membrane protein YesL
MTQALTLFGRAVRTWWREFPFLLVLNIIWLLAQATVVLGPPTTAALYLVAGRVLDGEVVDFGDLWRAWRQLAGRAWVWGAAQLVVYGVLGFNFWAYARGSGLLVLTLRYAWALLVFAWFTLNLYYWPLNLVQVDHRFSTTLSNAAKMALLNLNFTLAYGLCCLVFVVASVLSGALLGAVMMSWLALWGTLAVRGRLVPAAGNVER